MFLWARSPSAHEWKAGVAEVSLAALPTVASRHPLLRYAVLRFWSSGWSTGRRMRHDIVECKLRGELGADMDDGTVRPTLVQLSPHVPDLDAGRSLRSGSRIRRTRQQMRATVGRTTPSSVSALASGRGAGAVRAPSRRTGRANYAARHDGAGALILVVAARCRVLRRMYSPLSPLSSLRICVQNRSRRLTIIGPPR